MMLNSAYFAQDDARLHYCTMGDPENPPMLLLHGFPEYWGAWRDIMPFLAKSHFVIAPDQRGFNLSMKPAGVENYATRLLVSDMVNLCNHVAGGRKIILVGHDWGSAVAYALAFSNPHLVSHLIVVNGVHPWCFQQAILNDADQRAASQYMTRLRQADACEIMSADNYAKTISMIEKFSASSWMSDLIKNEYLKAYGQPGAMEAMLHWYRASPIVVPPPGEAMSTAPILELPRKIFTVKMPHLVVWGEADQALRPSCLVGLETFAAQLTIRRVADAGHWILHEHPETVSRFIGEFLGEA